MKETLRLHCTAHVGGDFGLLVKGDYVLGRGVGQIDPAVLKHWYIKALLSDGKAAVLKVEAPSIQSDAIPATAKPPRTSKNKPSKNKSSETETKTADPETKPGEADSNPEEGEAANPAQGE
jgi:hypothetical protein